MKNWPLLIVGIADAIMVGWLTTIILNTWPHYAWAIILVILAYAVGSWNIYIWLNANWGKKEANNGSS